MDDSFDVIVDFSMNEAANKRVLENAETVEQAYKDVEGQAKKTAEALRDAWAKQDQYAKSASNMQAGLGQRYEKTTEEIKKQAKEAAAAANAQARVWNNEARQLQARGRLLQLQSREMAKLADAVNIVSRAAVIGGVAVAGGIFKAATDYIKNAPEATRLTVEWKKAQDSLNQSYTRVGKTAAEAALPLLQKTAELAAKAAGFIETHPEMVKAALNAGLITAALGTIGLLVSKGIKLEADLLFVQSVPIMQEAATIQAAAAQQQLVAAQLQAEASGVEVSTAAEAGLTRGVTAGAGIGGLLGSIAVLTTSFIAGAIAADKAFDALQGHDVKFADYITEVKQYIAIVAKSFGDFLSHIPLPTLGGIKRFDPNTGNQMFEDVSRALGLLGDTANDTANDVNNLTGLVENSPAFEKILQVYEKYEEDDLKLVQDHYSKRRKIISSALDDEIAENKKFAEENSKLGSSTSKQLGKLQEDYDKNYLKAEVEHNKRRAEILRDAGEDVKNIEEQLQETLRKNFLDHQERTESIIAANDALGLAKENRRFEQQQAEERRQAALEIRKRRSDIGTRLQELDAEFQAERAQRLQEFQQRAIEIREQAEERQKELAAQHQAEIQKIKEQAAAKLKEEDTAFNAERKRRYDYVIAEIRDLDASLLGQRKLKLKYQQDEINDLNAFLAQYRARMATLGDAAPANTGRAEGGYTSGMAMTGEKGYEWIATHASTTAAESIIGRKLTQDDFMRAMEALRLGNVGTYVDNRRMEVPMSKDNRSAYRQGAMEALKEVLGLG